MAKTNFTKVEDILNKGLESLTVNELLILADQAAEAGDGEMAKLARARVAKAKESKERAHWISSIKRDLAIIQKRDKEFLKTLKIRKKELLELMSHPEKIDEKGWEYLHTLHDSLNQYKTDHLKVVDSDEDVVEAERLKHINKRFNVNDKWLPLK